ncbi:vitamin B12 dependent methionine synthase [Chloroflexota bacterium]
MEILDSIPVTLEVDEVVSRMQISRRNELLEGEVRDILEIARPVARPRVVYEVCYVDKKKGDSIEIGGVTFTSRVLSINLDKVERVFPYVATCGRELEEIAVPPDDLVKRYCLDVVKEEALASAHVYLRDHLVTRYALGEISIMNPASLEDWPLAQQRELFSLLGDVEGLIGVKLRDSLLMVPLKSVSGICFPTEIRFESCQLCPREKCISRRASFDPDMLQRYH